MDRRDALRTIATTITLSLAGCWGSTVTGSVAINETDGVITGSEPLLDATCRFLDSGVERLHGSTRRLEPPLEPGWTRELQFRLGGSVDEAERYELAFEWDARE